MHSKLSVSASTGRERISNAGTTVEEQSRERLMSADVQGKIGEVGLPATSQDLSFAAGSRWSTSVLLRSGRNRLRTLLPICLRNNSAIRISLDGQNPLCG